MKINRLRIDGFGRLQGEMEFAPDRCNLILAPNETGKSTLVAALLCALYGLPPERRSKHTPIPLREQFRPWDGESYALSVEFTLGDKGYRLRRDLARGDVQLVDEQTGKDIIDGYRGEGGSYPILEQLIGLERDDFARSSLVLQEEIQSIRDGGDITHRLQKFATSHGGDITAGEAVECLESALARYEGSQLAGRGRVETEIKRLDDLLTGIRSHVEALERDHAGIAGEIARADELGERERELGEELQRLDLLRSRAIVAEIEGQVEEQEAARRRRDRLREERDTLADYRDVPPDSEKLMHELKAEADQITGRITEARSSLEREAEEPLDEVRRQLESRAALLELTAEDAESLESLSVRLRDQRAEQKATRRKHRKEHDRLLDAGIDLEKAALLRGRFHTLRPDDRSFLEGYRERLLELEAADRRDPAAGTAPEANAGSTAWRLVAGGLSAASLAGAAYGWFELGSLPLTAGLASLGTGLLLFAAWPRGGGKTKAIEEGPLSPVEALRDRAEKIRKLMQFSGVDELVDEIRRLRDLERETAALEELRERRDALEASLERAREEAIAIFARAGRESTDEMSAEAVRQLRADLQEAQRLREREEELTARVERGREEAHELGERLEQVRLRMEEVLRRAERGAGRAAGGAHSGDEAPVGAAGSEVTDEIPPVGDGVDGAGPEATDESAATRDGGDGAERPEDTEAPPGPEISRRPGDAEGEGDPATSSPRTPEELAALLLAAAEKANRLRQLERELIPEVEAIIEPEERLGKRRSELRTMRAHLEEVARRGDEKSEVEPEHSPHHYVLEFKRVDDEQRAAQRERREILAKVGDLARRYREEIPRLVEQRERLETARRRAEQFRDAVQVATDLLREIARASYEEWASALNERSNRVLVHLNPAYNDLRFDTDLSFTLEDVATGRRLNRDQIDAHLSTGARDQVYLSVRLAISDFFSAGKFRLPLILDDVLSTADDARFERAMAFLTERVSRRHQVILLSCQQERHDLWRERHPDLFDARVTALALPAAVPV